MTTRQEIYDRIRQSSRDEVILDEMIRLGFWPRDSGMPKDPADDIRRQGELQRQLRALTAENSRLGNTEAIRKAARKQRMEESRNNRKENKERRLQVRADRAAQWRERKKSEILFLGGGVSAALNQQEPDAARLSANRVPELSTVSDLADAMEISVGELRWLSFHRKAATDSHYQRFGIRKKTGGIRIISAPMPRLKRAQQWILQNIIEPIELHRAAHGFRRGRSIVTNAEPHVNSDVVINVDVQDFFPTVTFPRVRGVFRHLGYSGQLATVLALLCSEPDQVEVELDGRTFYVARTPRRLPQGAPSSPGITNIICRGLDARLDRIALQLGFRYTRYADDITFSGSGEAVGMVGRALRRIRYAVKDEGFRLHPNKTRVLHKSRRQEVTGLVVNDGISIRRDLLRGFRAVLFQIERDGPAGKQWGKSGNVMLSIEGFANFVAMVDQEKGAVLQAQVRMLHDRYGRGERHDPGRQRWQPRVPTVDEDFAGDQSGTEREQIQRVTKKKPWWMFWKFW
ncbi:MAG: reverse transcriptase domain-containing protein [Planctomycetaceae bacterium]